jgi:phospholipid transport system transporter-binding protein
MSKTTQNVVGHWQLSGDITLFNSERIFQAGVNQIKDNVFNFDFSQVNQVDSSVVSLMLQWFRFSEGKLRYSNLPNNLDSLLVLYELSSFWNS